MRSLERELKTSKGRASSVSAVDFPYRFPPSPRRVGSGFPVADARRRLTQFYYCHLALLRTFAGWIIQIPEFEVKIELGHHIYAHAEAARLLRGRLLELRAASVDLNDTPARWKRLCLELLHAQEPSELLVGSHSVVTRALLQAEMDYRNATDELLDLPSIRVLGLIRPDLEQAVEWGDAAVSAYVSGGKSLEKVSEWRSHIELLLRALGGISGENELCDPPSLRQDNEPPFARAIGCKRDGRFTTFHQTRDYRRADDISNKVASGYEADRLDLIRVQRDEIDAIETFANVLFDLATADFELQMDLARFIWDESRHAEIGHQELERLGFDSFEVPCGIIGINVRSPLRPEIALAQISIFGELNIVGPMRNLSDRALACGDRQTYITFDFIHSDEVLHLRRGRDWLLRLHPSGDLKSLQEEARIQAIGRLMEEGVVGEDYAMNLSGSEIAALIGAE